MALISHLYVKLAKFVTLSHVLIFGVVLNITFNKNRFTI